MVPLRFVSDQLGAAVAWDGTTELVTVTTTDTPPDDGTEEPTPAVDPTDPTTLTGRYAMTGDALVVFPGQSEPQELPVSGWFDLVVEAGAADHNAYKSGLEGSLDGLVIPEAVAMEADAVDVESVSVELELDPDAVQSGSYDASSGEFWMVTTLAVEFPALGALAGPYQGIALEQGTLDSSTAAYSSTVSLSITSGPFAGVCAIFSKNGDREDSLDDIRELLEKDELTEEEKERVRDYLRESNASEADKIEVLKDLIDLAQKATGETLVITPLEVLEAIIAGLKNIEEQFYQNYKQMRDAGLIDGPEGFPNGTLRVRQKYEMRYLLEQLKDKLD
jgi:hypothetical protein